MDKKRVLYADNDSEYLNARCEFLEKAGYQVVKASNPVEAERILEQENIHLAVLDIRLVEDGDEGDVSGILLAKDERFARVPKIFVTGFPTFETVREAYGSLIGDEPIAHAFLAKKEGPEAFVKAVGTAFEKVIGINWKLKVTWGEHRPPGFPHLALLLESGLDPALLRARSSELEDLFRKLFSTDEQISIFRLNWFRDGCACLSLFALNKGSSRQAIVVFGLWEAVDEQRQRAEQYLGTDPAVVALPAFADSMRYAGLAYTVPDTAGSPLQTGSALFQEATDKSIRTALENLYTHTLHGWHQHERSEKTRVDLAAIYRDRLGITAQPEFIEQTRRKTQNLAEQACNYSLLKKMTFSGNEIEFVFPNGSVHKGPDPIALLFDSQAFDKQQVTLAATFGGIAASSILVDEEGRVYPTDMSGMTRSPVLEDFVSMECEFHFDRISSTNLLTLWDFEKQLCELRSLNDALPAGNVEPECRKSLAAIQTVRKLAAETAGEALTPYLVGLFHYTLKALLHYDPQFYLAKHQVAQLVHQLMAASLYAAQAGRLGEAGSQSGENPDESGGLEINEASREVSVDGREVRLTQTEFKLLLYLHKHPNRLCRWEEILSEVFELKETPEKSERGLLNTHMDRLRKKIDLNPVKHRYIVTIRGEGYRLDLKS